MAIRKSVAPAGSAGGSGSTSIGEGLLVSVPLPSWARSLAPQQVATAAGDAADVAPAALDLAHAGRAGLGLHGERLAAVTDQAVGVVAPAPDLALVVEQAGAALEGRDVDGLVAAQDELRGAGGGDVAVAECAVRVAAEAVDRAGRGAGRRCGTRRSRPRPRCSTCRRGPACSCRRTNRCRAGRRGCRPSTTASRRSWCRRRSGCPRRPMAHLPPGSLTGLAFCLALTGPS